jgi:hypothetical protein
MALFEIVTKKRLPRRTFLRATGVAIGLPFLDAMTGAFEPKPREIPRRFVAMCATLGFHAPYFTPKENGADYSLTPYLETLAPFRKKMTVFSGVSHQEQSGANGHTSELTWLTSAKRPGLNGFKNTISLDQYMASKIGNQTRYPYLALSTGGESLSWSGNGVQIPAESSPSKVFKQLFVNGTADEVKNQIRDLKRGQSILDTVLGQAKKLDRELGPKDRQKLDEYLTAVRGMENQLRESEGWTNRPKPKIETTAPTDISNRNDAIARTRLMNDMIVLALQTDSTRSITFRLAGLNSVPVVDGVKNDWHNLSHHGQDTTKIEELKLIEIAEFKALAAFLKKLEEISEQDVTLLDNTTVLYGSNLGNASSHDWHNLPILVAGGRFRHGQHLAFDSQNNLPLSNLFVSLLQGMKIHADKFGFSTASHVSGFEQL